MAVREMQEIKLIPIFENGIITGYTRIVNIACNSLDSKPTSGLANGSACIEVDTGKVYLFNEASSTWVELS